MISFLCALVIFRTPFLSNISSWKHVSLHIVVKYLYECLVKPDQLAVKHVYFTIDNWKQNWQTTYKS